MWWKPNNHASCIVLLHLSSIRSSLFDLENVDLYTNIWLSCELSYDVLSFIPFMFHLHIYFPPFILAFHYPFPISPLGLDLINKKSKIWCYEASWHVYSFGLHPFLLLHYTFMTYPMLVFHYLSECALHNNFSLAWVLLKIFPLRIASLHSPSFSYLPSLPPAC